MMKPLATPLMTWQEVHLKLNILQDLHTRSDYERRTSILEFKVLLRNNCVCMLVALPLVLASCSKEVIGSALWYLPN